MRYRVGTLVYTKAALVGVFFWVLWGDFILTLMETVERALLPVLLKDHGASDREIAIIVSTAAAVLTGILNPIVSYKSDRTRTRLGRRIPYLLFATPFVAVTVGLIPFSPEIASYLMQVSFFKPVFEAMPLAPVIMIFGIIVVAFQLFNTVILSIYYYLFRDVIPVAYLGRFMSSFRIVGYLATFVFNYWLFGKAEFFVREIFVGIALLYFLGFMLMCLKVKEGEYLPVEATEKTSGGIRQAVKNFLTQSFSAPIYCWIYITRSLVFASFISTTFIVFFAREQLHLSLDEFGKTAAWAALVSLPLAYPFGVMLDRLGSMRVMPYTLVAIIVANALAFLFVQDKITLLFFGAMTASAQFLFMIAQSVWLNRLFHPERIGQLSSASALTLSLIGIVAGPLCGQAISWIGDYRFAYVWPILLTTVALFSLRKARIHWLALGGRDNYQPPLPGSKLSEMEEDGLDKPPVIQIDLSLSASKKSAD